jgi:simple sugar transport system ATP-binding protein
MEELTDDGRSLIFITHKLEEAMTAADTITVLRDGKSVGTVDADETSEQELARMMVGRDVLFETEERTTEPGDEILETDDLRVCDDRGIEQVTSVDLTVRSGEVLGIAGVDGNGQAELVEAITGLRPAASGTVTFRGETFEGTSRRERIESGIAYIPEDRQEEGLVQDYDLVRNALLGNQTIEPYVDGGFIDWSTVREHAEDIIEAYDVQPPNAEAEAASLSGGNQQKFVVGRELERDPDLVVASHPTRGVDIGSIEFIHNRLLEMRDAGLGVLLVSSKLDEIQKLSDRLAVMYEGEFVDIVDPDDVTESEIGLMMAGRGANETDTEREEVQP